VSYEVTLTISGEVILNVDAENPKEALAKAEDWAERAINTADAYVDGVELVNIDNNVPDHDQTTMLDDDGADVTEEAF
jgi:hypothetical protein